MPRRKPDPARIYQARRDATAARFFPSAMPTDEVERWLAAWEAYAARQGPDSESEGFWSQGFDWIDAERRRRRSLRLTPGASSILDSVRRQTSGDPDLSLSLVENKLAEILSALAPLSDPEIRNGRAHRVCRGDRGRGSRGRVLSEPLASPEGEHG